MSALPNRSSSANLTLKGSAKSKPARPSGKGPSRTDAKRIGTEVGRTLTRLLKSGSQGWPMRGVMTDEQALRLLEQPELTPRRSGPVFTTRVVWAAKALLRGNPGLSAKQVHWRLVELGFPMGSERATRMVVADIRFGRK